ncbi:3-hydroxyacyl-CoA dehydrogenase [Aquirufa ecclesiirivi]|uniref:3-hydroxyacyl-CoA dehydrogenase n=1 Tax=Aquirufa ecclesiirivi TaxID=2715124 RepID=UPI00140A412E|nr:3-hydroxyacyl-CoA dehydrogenase [Aquirufa ecclesiirivi]MDF0693674.1 3-hydroxyacyl-CoA dehydrogenase [Aquirufa ecclesiirivi]NHC49931.1 3-hydroxyacyl-CoA dehydrogenase [Aquirufa ecclesiirivi]
MEIKQVCILGAGTLGTRIAFQAALSGYWVKVYDIKEESFTISKKMISKIAKGLIASELYTQLAIDEAFTRLSYTLDDEEAVAEADIISESVTEDLALKQQVWARMGQIAPEKTIFTTNTSYLLPSSLASFTGRPSRFCAFHFHDVFYSKIVDIMPHPGTDAEVIEILQDFGQKLKQVPVVLKKENHGYIFNAMLLSFLGAAGKLLVNEVATIEDIDKSWMVNFHVPMGPFAILDSIGLDTAWHVTHQLPDAHSKSFAALLKTYVDAGKLGEKSGEGFYRY